MTTITKERLLTIKQWRETYGPGSNVVLPAEEAEELARIALASLEAEPVASCIIEDGCMCVDGFGEYVGHSLPDGTHQLYAARQCLISCRVNTETVGLLRIVIMLKAGTTAAKPCFSPETFGKTRIRQPIIFGKSRKRQPTIR